MSGNANRESDEVIARWHKAIQRLDNAKRELNSAEFEASNAANEAGKHLCPADAEIGESFQMWIDTDGLGMPEKERLVNVTKTAEGEYALKWRRRKAVPSLPPPVRSAATA